jgi:REP-associated tyrosine transposase
MSRKYKFQDPDKLYFVSFAVVYWIDVFIRNEYKDIVLDSWRYCIMEKGMELYGWIIMTSHIHMIVGSHGQRLDAIMRDMKKHSSRELKKAILANQGESRKEWMLWMMERAGKRNSNNGNFQFWQQDNHPIELVNMKMAHQKLDYIHQNPVVAGIVDYPEQYLYSSARDYYGGRGLIEVSLLEPLLK